MAIVTTWMITCPAVGQQILYVKANATGANDGSSWADAFTDLQDALAAAISGTQIWVATGTYKPTGPSGERTRTFQLVPGVSVYGGFVGLETEISQRNPVVNVTTLSGDLAGNDGPDFAGNNENSYHVVSATSATAEVDGFTITGGNANGAGNHSRGGGLRIEDSSSTFSRCTFLRNSADLSGGGAYSSNSSPTFFECRFAANRTVMFSGGTHGGAGMFCDDPDSPPNDTISLRSCSFDGNNTPHFGGGLGILRHYALRMVYCTFVGNSAGSDGGGLYTSPAAGPFDGYVRAANCDWYGNAAAFAGGGVYIGRHVNLTNSLFSGNQASGMGPLSGGSACFFAADSALMLNCTISHNVSQVQGSAAVQFAFGTSATSAGPYVLNSVVHGNIASTGIAGGPAVEVSWSSIDTGWSGTGMNNNTATPLFVDDNGSDEVYGTVDDNLRLMAASPCVDAASSIYYAAYAPDDEFDLDEDGIIAERVPFDLDGAPRFADDVNQDDMGEGMPPFLDRGCYESRDCDGNQVPDLSELAGNDCNENFVLDECEISQDSQAPGGPFYCMLGCDPDCNNNGIPDECDISGGSSAPGGPFYCDPLTMTCDADCNNNGVPDTCDLGPIGISDDCNVDGIPDECPLAGPVDSTWNAAAGFWSDDEAWCPPIVPDNGSGQSFAVDVPQANDDVTLDVSPTIDSLTVGAGAHIEVNDGSGADVRVLIVTGTIVNQGTLEATDRERLVLDAPVIDQTGGGALVATDGAAGAGEAGAKSILEINGSQVMGGSATATDLNSEIHLIGGAELVNVAVQGMVVPDGQNGGFSEAITNSGILEVGQGGATSTHLAPTQASAMLMGDDADGTFDDCVRLGHQSLAHLGAFRTPFTNAANHQIDGKGIVFGQMTNLGRVVANQPGQRLNLYAPGPKTNNGAFIATNGGTLRVGDVVDFDDSVVGAGQYVADAGTLQVRPGAGLASITGTTMEAMNAGQIHVTGSAAISLSGSLTLESGARYEADPAEPDTSASLSAATVTMKDGATMDLSDAMMLEVMEALIVDGLDDNECLLEGENVPPIFIVADAAVTVILGDFILTGPGVVSYQSSAAMSLAGSFINQSMSPQCFDCMQGDFVLTGMSVDFEVAGKDDGPISFPMATQHFAMGQVQVSGGADVTFRDTFNNNSGSPQDACTEALYAQTFILDSGAAITLENVRIYADQIINMGTGVSITLLGCGQLVLTGSDFNGDGQIDSGDYIAFQACLAGPDVPAGSGCAPFDADGDADADLADFSYFQASYGASGP